MSTFCIKKHGVIIERSAPQHPAGDAAARRRAVLSALEILHPVLRPLALEISLGPLDPDAFDVERVETRRIAVRSIPPGVASASAFADAPDIELVDALTPEVVLAAITPAESGWDIASVNATVTAARITVDQPVLDTYPSYRVPVIELDGARWLVGPIDVQGYRLEPPIALEWWQDYGDLRLRIDARWSLWWSTDSAEYIGLRTAERALDAAGFTPQLVLPTP